MAPPALTDEQLDKVNALLKKTFDTATCTADATVVILRLITSCESAHFAALEAQRKRLCSHANTEQSTSCHLSVVAGASPSLLQSPDELDHREWFGILQDITRSASSSPSVRLAFEAVKELVRARCSSRTPPAPLSSFRSTQAPDGSSSPLVDPYYFSCQGSSSPHVDSFSANTFQDTNGAPSPSPASPSLHSALALATPSLHANSSLDLPGATHGPSSSLPSSTQEAVTASINPSSLVSIPALGTVAQNAADDARHDLAIRALKLYAREWANSVPGRLKIAHLCRKLRAILAIPGFWTRVCGVRSSKFDALDAILQLSGRWGFTFVSDSGTGDSDVNFAALALHASRLRAFELTSDKAPTDTLYQLLCTRTERLVLCRLDCPLPSSILSPGRFLGPTVKALACLVDQLAQVPFPNVLNFEALAPDRFRNRHIDPARRSHTAQRIMQTFKNLQMLTLRAWLEDCAEWVYSGPALQSLAITETEWPFDDYQVMRTFQALRSSTIQSISVDDAPRKAVTHLRSEIEDCHDTFDYRPSASSDPAAAILYMEALHHIRLQRQFRGAPLETIERELYYLRRYKKLAVLGIPNDLGDREIRAVFKVNSPELRELELYFVEDPTEDLTVLTFPGSWTLPRSFNTLALTGIGQASVDAGDVLNFIWKRGLQMPSRSRLNVLMRNLEFNGGREAPAVRKLKAQANVVFL
ncbi:hypothetical protein EXIGLDRAFT_841509 [Exidia glandulosa HHB12029]|uniref:Uncharacterized protein n=1 Tax=Exidia glandulosa HHB12029 TaxID=1314781 RepID=A0A165DUC9_EXIGL|nr:hypothetical protein EXIGLDRAFT_841509 [Exidia glandulosa HHB12029]